MSLEEGKAPPEEEAPPRRDPLRTRTRLLEAAIEEFSAQGFHGARTERIVRQAGTNIRMLYHYFGSKDELYVAVLEVVLGELRHDELRIDPETAEPLPGLLHVFDYVDGHFGSHPALRKLLAFENLNEARHLVRSERILTLSSPVLSLIGRLLARGEAQGQVRAGLDPLHLYVAMVSLAYYGRAHAFTLSHIFGQDLHAGGWQRSHLAMTREMVASFLRPATGGAEPALSAPRARRSPR
ncbi:MULTISPECIES: TetR/AcrR family transcriptional regulator [Ramlibacter]|uniref:TetR family transcriptional regulator n=1 Tax=Ramlibacter aquaticus TaxID=2780094 RepID=A0ABR9SI54_9BURK|nr:MULTISPECIES: TetR/AcrR family transcriptional regulator [Ramlibacter]MBE7942039.1 TetR family transcriptional regulator [Ramlibacter aquaticus]